MTNEFQNFWRDFKKIGGEGSFSFELTNMEDIRYSFELDNEIDKKKFCKLNIFIFTPKGMKNCFDISLSSEHFLLHHYHKDYYISSKEEMELLNKETNINNDELVDNWLKVFTKGG